MSTKRFAVSTLILLIALCLPSCSERNEPAADGKIRVVAAIPPLAYFVDRIGDGHVQTTVLVAPGQDPHVYEPTPKQVAGLAAAQLYFKVGMPFEKALAERVAAANPKLETVDVCQGIKLRTMTESEADQDEGEKAEEHGHHRGVGDLDPHVWLSPRNARILAATIELALAGLDPAHAAEFARNRKALDADLDAMDAKLKAILAPLKGRELMVFHPAFGYLADAYGLRQVSVETEGMEPGPKQLGALIQKAKADGVKVIFAQPQFSTKNAETIAHEIGGAVVLLDDLAYDYLANLNDMAAKIEKALALEK